MLTIKGISQVCVFTIASLCAAGLTQAAVSSEEAKALGDTLTRFGAEKAGNADGSIPPYTGGLQPVPEYDRETMQTYINPYKDEQPLYSITHENMGEYADVLMEGTKGLLKKYPSYRVDVYQTHRSPRYPDWVLENSVKNATTATLAGEVMGDAIVGEGPRDQPFPGVPFPIPENGYEVMWNAKLAFAPPVQHQKNRAFLVDSKGGVSDLPSPYQFILRPWYDESGRLREQAYNAVLGFYSRQTAPPRAAGVTFLNFYLPSAEDGGQLVWFYTPGQRRARRAPDFAYDLPISAYGGVLLWDEIFGFVGRMDRYNFKLVGKQEKIIPYNAYKMTQEMPPEQVLGKNHINPDAMRFEKHRVWVVEAERKEGERHVYKKRRFYIDEDSWHIVATDSYDDSDRLWRTAMIHTFPSYDVGGINDNTWTYDDLLKGNYMALSLGAMLPNFWNRAYIEPEKTRELNVPLTPRQVEAQGIR